jgi:hypothetical protein
MRGQVLRRVAGENLGIAQLRCRPAIQPCYRGGQGVGPLETNWRGHVGGCSQHPDTSPRRCARVPERTGATQARLAAVLQSMGLRRQAKAPHRGPITQTFSAKVIQRISARANDSSRNSQKRERQCQYGAGSLTEAARAHPAVDLRFSRRGPPRSGACIGSSGPTRTWRRWLARAKRACSGVGVATLLAVATVPAYGDVARTDICAGCELFLGIGYTYHMWGETGGFVLPATLTLDRGRYEVGVFRFTSDQTLYEDLWGKSRVLAHPYWSVSTSRRWQLAARPEWRAFVGFGVSYKTEEDQLNATHWNFAEQIGVRLHHVLGAGSDMEFAFRHWSNAGLRCPNRGQDFMTVTIAF